MNNGSMPVAGPVLTSWKDIARYMGKGVRTVQRWEQDFGLPVRRPLGSSKKAILARPQDLDAWVALRCSSRTDVHADSAASTGRPCSSLSLGALTALNAQIQTSRMLRSSHSALLADMRGALDDLKQQVIRLTVSH